MTTTQKRNQQIVRTWEEGVSRQDLAQWLNLSEKTIRLIERQATEKPLPKKRIGLRADIQAADDPDKKGPVIEVTEVLGWITATRNRLLEHFTEAGKAEISFRN
jgi:DNA-binding XRE family transcriptional regulator